MILAVTNQKGGTGKSTLATNLAVCFARTGAAVLLVDADPQHSALDWCADRPAQVPLIHSVVPADASNVRMSTSPGPESSSADIEPDTVCPTWIGVAVP